MTEAGSDPTPLSCLSPPQTVTADAAAASSAGECAEALADGGASLCCTASALAALEDELKALRGTTLTSCYQAHRRVRCATACSPELSQWWARDVDVAYLCPSLCQELWDSCGYDDVRRRRHATAARPPTREQLQYRAAATPCTVADVALRNIVHCPYYRLLHAHAGRGTKSSVHIHRARLTRRLHHPQSALAETYGSAAEWCAAEHTGTGRSDESACLSSLPVNRSGVFVSVDLSGDSDGTGRYADDSGWWEESPPPPAPPPFVDGPPIAAIAVPIALVFLLLAATVAALWWFRIRRKPPPKSSDIVDGVPLRSLQAPPPGSAAAITATAIAAARESGTAPLTPMRAGAARAVRAAVAAPQGSAAAAEDPFTALLRGDGFADAGGDEEAPPTPSGAPRERGAAQQAADAEGAAEWAAAVAATKKARQKKKPDAAAAEARRAERAAAAEAQAAGQEAALRQKESAAQRVRLWVQAQRGDVYAMLSSLPEVADAMGIPALKKVAPPARGDGAALRKSYHRAAGCLHPDKVGKLPEQVQAFAEEVFKALSEAYQAETKRMEGGGGGRRHSAPHRSSSSSSSSSHHRRRSDGHRTGDDARV